MQRGRFPGSDKMCACNTAELTLVIVDNDGKEHQVFESLKLNSKMEWLLSQFFLCIGQKKKGEALRPNWNAVPGSRGMAEITVNEYKDKNGNAKKNNRSANTLPRNRSSLRQVYSDGIKTLPGRSKGIHF